MGITLKPERLKRYKDLAWLLLKYSRSDLARHATAAVGAVDGTGEDERLVVTPGDARMAEEADAFAHDLEQMGPTFIKLGQLLSTRPDVLPLPYTLALARLQDRIAPFPFSEVERIVADELGVRLSRAFGEVDPVPLAAASLGQVHRARLRDGRPVALKVQRPGIRQQVMEDLDALQEVAGMLDRHTDVGRQFQFQRVLDEFRRSLLRELDYRREASNLATLGTNLRDFDRIVVPAPVDDFTTSRVLTMDFIKGKKVTSLSPLARLEVDGAQLAEQLFQAYLKQILVDGFFHADPHPGNVFLTDEGNLALIDLGMVAHLTRELQEKLLQLLLAIGEGRAEEAAYFAMRLGERGERFEEPVFRRRVANIVAAQRGVSAEEMEIGKTMLEVTQVSGECDIRIPPELTLLGKALLNLDQVGTTLDPSFDPNAAIRRHAGGIFQQRLTHSVSPGGIFSSLIDMRDFVEMLPRRVNQIMERIAENDLSIKVDAIDEPALLAGLQKIANRITMGLVLAALILGAAIMTSVPTDFRIFGYPGAAIIFFILAAAGGVLLMANIVMSDVRPGSRRR